MILFKEPSKTILKFMLSRKNSAHTEQKKQSWRYQNIQLQTILQSHNNNKNNLVLAQKQI
jgi:hypothetical protein